MCCSVTAIKSIVFGRCWKPRVWFPVIVGGASHKRSQEHIAQFAGVWEVKERYVEFVYPNSGIFI